MEHGEQAAGQMLNFYKRIAVSPAAFKGYMDLNATLQEGALDRKVQEPIVVPDYDGCV